MPKYFIAVLPPELISIEIKSYQKEVEKDFAAVHAQKAPPHITVIPPFDCSLEKIKEFSSNLKLYFNNKSTIDIHIKLDNFQRFESRTLFVDVAKNVSFEKLCKELKMLFNQQKIMKQRIEKHYFIPHITLANKDIKKRNFKVAWLDFKNRTYERVFKLEYMSVLELKDGKWELHKTIKLK